MVNQMKKIILDTDIGSDVDDALALALCVKSEKIKLEGITTVYGDTELCAKIAFKLLKIMKIENVPIAKGEKRPLTKNKNVWLTGQEGKDVSGKSHKFKYSFQNATDFIISRIMTTKKQITIISIAPLTNIATALKKEPKIASNIKELILMGGVLNRENSKLPVIEHNIGSDPEAAKIVFNSNIPITMVPLNVTIRIFLTTKEIQRINETNSELTNVVSKMIMNWLEFTKREKLISKIFRNRIYLHDPLTVGVAINRNFVKTKRMKILIKNNGETIFRDNKNSNVNVCIDADIERFKKFFLERICI